MDTFKPVEECFRVLPISASANPTRKEYIKIEEALNAKELYDPVFLLQVIDMHNVTGLISCYCSFFTNLLMDYR